MKVHELISKLERMPAGADVMISQFNTRTEDIDYFKVNDFGGGELLDEGFGVVYLEKGTKQ